MASEMHEQINDLLHDAERALSGAEFADTMARMQPHNADHAAAAKNLRAKHATLLREACELDPQHEAPAWQETTLVVPEAHHGG